MNTRTELNNKFKQILGNGNVYYQPPENVKLKYDCIIYKNTAPYTRRANNNLYILQHSYQVTFITSNPVSTIPDKFLEEFPMIDRINDFLSDNRYHYVFVLYF
jgi:hypothetical protein